MEADYYKKNSSIVQSEEVQKQVNRTSRGGYRMMRRHYCVHVVSTRKSTILSRASFISTGATKVLEPRIRRSASRDPTLAFPKLLVRRSVLMDDAPVLVVPSSSSSPLSESKSFGVPGPADDSRDADAEKPCEGENEEPANNVEVSLGVGLVGRIMTEVMRR